jgi:hypothetical protein
MGRVFISYAHEDEKKAKTIKARLEEFGFDTWIDHRAPASKDDISTVIDAALHNVDSVLVLWSEDSMKSVWVRGEALRGLEGNKYIGVLLSPKVPPVPFNAMLAPDLSEWSGLNEHHGWDALVRGLASMSKRASDIIAKLDQAQAVEREEAARLASQQPDLPLDPIADEALDEETTYSDVDAIVSIARTMLASTAKLNLPAALTQAALDMEMLRDAAYVVRAEGEPERPIGSHFQVVRRIEDALQQANDGDLVVVQRGIYDECVKVRKKVRIVGTGLGQERPIIRANGPRPAVTLGDSVRLENFSIETRLGHYAVSCEQGRPTILRCDIRRFSEARDQYDAALYVAGKANPVVMASSVASTGCAALYFVANSAGQFLGVNIVALRGVAIRCRGRSQFLACNIEAIGAHAIEVLGAGRPAFEACEISGRGATVVAVRDTARPKIRETRLTAIRQLAFDFSDQAMGRYEANIVAIEGGADAGTGRKPPSDFFGLFRSKQEAVVRTARKSVEFARLRDQSRPLFIANTTPDGSTLKEPALVH